MVTRINIGIVKNNSNYEKYTSLFIGLTLLSLGCRILRLQGKYRRLGPKAPGTIKETAAGCEPGSTYKYLDINNVRTLIYSYGNGWFLENAEYEIPKGSKKTSMFSIFPVDRGDRCQQQPETGSIPLWTGTDYSRMPIPRMTSGRAR